MNNIYELAEKIRLHISRTEKQNRLLANTTNWQRCCASLDIIEDAQCAIDYYSKSNYPEETNGKYLFTYGLLQALFLQQDAIRHLNQSLLDENIKLKNDYPDLFDIRELRNNVSGHPTGRLIHLSRNSMNKESFTYLCASDLTLEDVNILEILETQTKFIMEILEKMIEKLDEEFIKFIKKFKEQKLIKIFNELTYIMGKTNESSHSYMFKNKEDYGFKVILSILENFKSALNERYQDWKEVDSCKYLIENAEDLYAYLTEGINKDNSSNKAFLKNNLLENLFSKLKDLKLIAKELDEYFENYGEIPIEESNLKEMPKLIVNIVE